jgi:putative spermidine/putrescine transport system substrate-binding protein
VFVAAEKGLLRQHNTANIANFAMLRPAFDMADGFSAGCVDAMHTIYYNTSRRSEAPTAWADLWDPANKGQIAIPPVTWNSGVRMVTTVSQITTGLPMAEAQYDWEAGIAKLAELKDNGVVAYTGAPQAIQMMQSGSVPLVPFYGAFVNPMIAQGAPLAPATQLAEGKHGEIVGLNMPVNAPKTELAEVYVNMSLSKEFQAKIDSVLNALCGPSEIDPSPETLALVGPADNMTYADWAWLSKNRATITDKWNEVFG